MEGDRREILRWFVKFAQAEDLNELELGSKEEEYLFPVREREVIKTYIQRSSSRSMSQWEISKPESLKTLFKDLGWMFSARLPEKGSGEYWQEIYKMQKTVHETITLFLHQKWHGIRADHVGLGFWEFKAGEGKRFTLSAHFLAKNQDQYLKFKIIDLLNGLPVSFLNVCRGCGKFFIQESFRLKKSCSPKCLSRFNTRKWRATHLQKYKDDQAQMMWERYETEVHKEHPHAVIKRRAPRAKRVKKEG
jgi:hypothetical protein